MEKNQTSQGNGGNGDKCEKDDGEVFGKNILKTNREVDHQDNSGDGDGKDDFGNDIDGGVARGEQNEHDGSIENIFCSRK